ncbi:acyl-CoA dehydrogenase [Janthinobacterium sp. ROICE36]|uniref:acyl-CoA dehydrogenase family protein n=1 Tax=Janthinobacterium sp. ROICE36 TaxID=2048670 RepID=UPI000C7F1BCA|nr:acyl-CoA dehydrogenase family protein [Janthinobacterium sp. ROICE36]PLY43744.1 acyl-CoA dehydrogenase [Janthinobacterium sp. ROICE36]
MPACAQEPLQDAIRIATALAARLAETANARDQAGGHAAQEREGLRDSGLLTLSIPVEFGGQGASWPLVYQVIRILARADSALAHVFAFHHLQLAGLQRYGSAQQQRRLLALIVDERLFWGNALNPLDKRVTAIDSDDGYLLDGIKRFSSGSVGSDWLTISAWHAPTQTALIAALPTRQEGVTVQADWDAFGQRQTDSGNVHFQAVALPQEMEIVFRKGALAVSVAEAKCLAHKAGLEISSQMFELTGARSTSAQYGFDRYWRNVRVHTLHDPIDYKLRDLGRFALTGTPPEPTAYSSFTTKEAA